MSFFYATRTDKSGNTLMTSYTNRKSADKYGGADADITEDILFGEFRDNYSRLRISPEAGGLVVRSYMKNPKPSAAESGRYVLWGKTEQNGWERTSFSFSSYGAANTTMKALIGAYSSMLVLDENDAHEDVPAPARAKLDLDDL